MNGAIEFTPEKAWQAALASLELDMSRASFNTWVRPIHLVEFVDDTFVIGCINAYGRDWLEGRLTAILQRFLSGALNRAVKVRFVVCDRDVEQVDDFGQEENEISEVGEEKPIDLEIHYSSIRNILLEPERVVRFPTYYFRWLPYVGSQIIFLAMALWQENYLSGAGKARKGNGKVSVRAERVCQWAGISRAQFFRILQPGSGLEWFARKIETEHEVDSRSGRMKKSSNKYELFDSPLTPGDVEDLRAYLTAHGIQESPESALRAAAGASPKDILQYPIRLPPEGFEKTLPHYQTVQHVVRELVGHRLDGELMSLADQLADRLTGAGDFMLVSWYFLKNWLPILGSDAAMLVLLLRNLCYFNDETGEIRNEVWMDGGYAGIAQRLGIDNPRVVANWLPAWIERGKRKAELSERSHEELARRRRLQELLGLFVERTDHRINPEGHYAWKFKVQRIDPLIPQHQAVQQALSTILVKVESQGVLDELVNWVGKFHKDCVQHSRAQRVEDETVTTAPMVVSRLSEATNDCSDTLRDILKDCLETLDLLDKDCFETLLKILVKFKDSLQDKNTSSTQDSSLSPKGSSTRALAVMTDSDGRWSLGKLLSRADKKNRDILIEQENNAIPLVSWLIYGASKTSIRNPFSLAIARLKENPGIGAGGASERLAARPPDEFAHIIQQSLSFYGAYDADWQMLFRGVGRDRIRLLADSLGFIPDTGASVIHAQSSE